MRTPDKVGLYGTRQFFNGGKAGGAYKKAKEPIRYVPVDDGDARIFFPGTGKRILFTESIVEEGKSVITFFRKKSGN